MRRSRNSFNNSTLMLNLVNIQKNFSYKTVLSNVSITFREGIVYSLLGENGAGKSTLAHILCGDIIPTSGSIILDEKVLKIKNPKDAIKNGIVCVHQRPLLVADLSIKDNLRIGINKLQEKQITKVLENWLPGHKETELVKNLNEQEVFYTSLCGALLKNPKILILDEPPFLDTKQIRTLADSGLTIILITHNFKEAIEKSDDVVLLKDGIVLEQKKSNQITETYIKEKLFGLTQEFAVPGQIETCEISEEKILQQRKVETKKHIQPLTGYIPSDRTFRASNPNLTVLQILTAYHTNFKQTELKEYAQSLLKMADVNIKLNEKASCLSGGMLQRLILERELAENPNTIYLFEPTHGLDAEATDRLYSRLKKISEKGTKVIFGNSSRQGPAKILQEDLVQ